MNTAKATGPHRMQTLGTLIAILAAATLLIPASLAQSDDGRIARNLERIGQVCLEGETCGTDAVAATTAAPATPEPEPVAAAAESAVTTQSDFDLAGAYQLSCFACHSTGAGGAPITGDAVAWGERTVKGMDELVASVVNGLGVMPPGGMCMDCSEDNIRELIDFMTTSEQ